MKRSHFSAIIGSALLVFFVARFGYFVFAQPDLDTEALRAIRIGMTEQELLAAMGCEAKDYGAGWPREVYHEDFNSMPKSADKELQWRTDFKGIVVWLDKNGIVRGKSSHIVIRDIGPIDRWRRFLGLEPLGPGIRE